jgi:hypothetical protein
MIGNQTISCYKCGCSEFLYDSYWKEYSCEKCGWVVNDDKEINIIKNRLKKTALEQISDFTDKKIENEHVQAEPSVITVSPNETRERPISKKGLGASIVLTLIGLSITIIASSKTVLAWIALPAYVGPGVALFFRSFRPLSLRTGLLISFGGLLLGSAFIPIVIPLFFGKIQLTHILTALVLLLSGGFILKNGYKRER